MSTHLHPVTDASVSSAKASALAELREAAVQLALERGHDLGPWHELSDEDCAIAYCRACWRSVAIDVLRDPHLAGTAIAETCGSTR